jgi:hypothetical protein
MIDKRSFLGYGSLPVIARFLVAAACSMVFTGCPSNDDNDSERAALPDWSDGYEKSSADGGISTGGSDGGDVASKSFPDNSFGIAIPETITHPIRLRVLDTKNYPCAIAQGASKADITCIIDINELDLYVLGLAYNIVAPKGMCDFVEYHSFIFENFEIGEGPKEVSWTVQEYGAITDSVNAVSGVPRCPYDYSGQYPSSPKAPNCCYGTYTKRVTNAKTGKVEQSTEVWDGNLAQCYHGAAYLDMDAAFTQEGWPIATIIYTDRKPLSHTVRYHGLSDKYATNAVLANYHYPVDNNPNIPSAAMKRESYSYYNISCLDDAEEVIAHIRLVVREWNEEAQFDMDSDSETEGLEPGWETPINDITDWSDLLRNNIEYPKILPVGQPY